MSQELFDFMNETDWQIVKQTKSEIQKLEKNLSDVSLVSIRIDYVEKGWTYPRGQSAGNIRLRDQSWEEFETTCSNLVKNPDLFGEDTEINKIQIEVNGGTWILDGEFSKNNPTTKWTLQDNLKTMYDCLMKIYDSECWSIHSPIKAVKTENGDILWETGKEIFKRIAIHSKKSKNIDKFPSNLIEEMWGENWMIYQEEYYDQWDDPQTRFILRYHGKYNEYEDEYEDEDDYKDKDKEMLAFDNLNLFKREPQNYTNKGNEILKTLQKK